MKIAIVGNGKLSKNYGKSIDKCEAVIRFNKAQVEGYKKTHGTKTNILSIVGETKLSYKSGALALSRDILNQVNEIWITGRIQNKNHEELIKHIAGKGIMYKYLNYDDYVLLCRQIDSKYIMSKCPSTGINTLCYVINAYPRTKISVYGFDCFKSGHYYDDEKRNNHEFHDLDIERKIIEYLKQRGISFFN